MINYKYLYVRVRMNLEKYIENVYKQYNVDTHTCLGLRSGRQSDRVLSTIRTYAIGTYVYRSFCRARLSRSDHPSFLPFLYYRRKIII